MQRNCSCDLCELGVNSSIRPKNICLMTLVPEEVDIVIVAEGPTQIDDTHGRIFAGKALNDIVEYFSDTGMSIHTTYAEKCTKPGKTFKLKDTHVKTCSNAYLKPELAACKPKHIICFGANALYGATGMKGITDKRGNRHWNEKLNAFVYPTVHWAQSTYDEQAKITMLADMELFKQWITGGEVEQNAFNPLVIEVSTLDALRAMVKNIEEAGWVAAVDTETTGLNPYDPAGHIRTIQFCWDVDYGGTYIPLNIGDDCFFMEGDIKVPAEPYWTDEEWPEVGQILKDLMLKCKCIWSNGKFDRLWLHLWGKREFGYPIECPNICMDTLHVAHLLDENRPLGLKKLITQELGYPTYDIPDKLTKNLSILFPYAAKDTVASLLLAEKYSDQLADPDLAKIKKFYSKVIRKMDAVFTTIELRGWPVHEKEALRVLADLQSKKEIIQAQMLEYLQKKNITEVTSIGPTGKESVSPVDASVFSSAYKLPPLLFDCLHLPQHQDKTIAFTATGGRSTKEDALIHVKDHPFVTFLLDWKGLTKAISTYALPMLEAAKHRGRLTTSYKLTGTTTGRTASGKEGRGKSSSGMNLQNLPHDERDVYDDGGVLMKSALVHGIRDIIRPADDDPYDTIVEVDFSALEMRVAAEYSKDPFMLRAYKENRDLHMLRAMRILHPDETNWDTLTDFFKELKERDPAKAKEVRQNAKPCNFGYLFGMGAAKFQQMALADYGLNLSMSECIKVRKSFFADHKGLEAWYKKQENFAKKHGYVENLAGRRRHLPNMLLDPDSSGDARKKYTDSLRNAINMPVQGFGSELKLMSLIEIEAELSPVWGYIIGEIHDSIVLQCRHAYTQQVIEFVINVMRHPKLLDELGIKLTVPLDAEGKSGPSLGKAH